MELFVLQGEKLMVEIPDARGWSPESLELFRRMAVRAVLELGKTRKEVAEFAGVSEHVVGQWCADFHERGTESFSVQTPGRPIGSGRSLSSDQEATIQDKIINTVPKDHGIGSSSWTRATVGELISRLFDIELSDQGVGNYLKRWKMTPQKPTRHAREADAAEVEEFMDKTLPETLEKAEKMDGEVHFADETGLCVDDQIGRSYAPQGQTPVLTFPKTRIAQNMISSVTADGEMLYWIYSGTMNAERFIEWLKSLLSTTTKKIFLLIDSHPAHTANAVEEWVSDRAERLELIWLPRYSPEHNPDEFLNNDLKQNLKHEPLPESRSEFRQTITRIMDGISESVDRVKGYFRKSQIASAFQK